MTPIAGVRMLDEHEENSVTNADQALVLAIDLGKTSCRARLLNDTEVLAEARGPGAPGLADHNGAGLAFAAIENVVAQLSPSDLSRIGSVGIGAAGVEAGRDAARELCTLVRGRIDAPVAIINDALAAHAGAFDGSPGAILIAGTGAILFAVSEAGSVRQIDGWGPWLGDDGSGQWIGRHGLQAVLRAHDGRGSATALTEDAVQLAGAIEALPRWVSDSGAPARQLGRFAPMVLQRAEDGDPVSVTIIADATALLAATCAASGMVTVCVSGGLSAHPYFSARMREALDAVGMRTVDARGDALDGSALIAVRTDLPYEERIIRG
jgi:N-acetylglucosamine kinase-like BadF-type ATPase